MDEAMGIIASNNTRARQIDIIRFMADPSDFLEISQFKRAVDEKSSLNNEIVHQSQRVGNADTANFQPTERYSACFCSCKQPSRSIKE